VNIIRIDKGFRDIELLVYRGGKQFPSHHYYFNKQVKRWFRHDGPGANVRVTGLEIRLVFKSLLEAPVIVRLNNTQGNVSTVKLMERGKKKYTVEGYSHRIAQVPDQVHLAVTKKSAHALALELGRLDYFERVTITGPKERTIMDFPRFGGKVLFARTIRNEVAS